MRGATHDQLPQGTVYLIGFATPYAHARHYTGSTQDLRARLELHRSGFSARLLQVLARAGIEWALAWEVSRRRERQLKRQRGAARRCPMYRAERQESGL